MSTVKPLSRRAVEPATIEPSSHGTVELLSRQNVEPSSRRAVNCQTVKPLSVKPSTIEHLNR